MQMQEYYIIENSTIISLIMITTVEVWNVMLDAKEIKNS